jgi:hypothetical protein
MNRVLLGAIAGAAATLPMTMAMRRGHRRLRQRNRYPLPPREIIQQLGSMPHQAEATIGARFAYGAIAGAIFSIFSPRRSAGTGALFGALNWVIGYFGWAPLVGVLKPAHRHPVPRSVLMFVAHLVWVAVLPSDCGSSRRRETRFSGAARCGTRQKTHPWYVQHVLTGRTTRALNMLPRRWSPSSRVGERLLYWEPTKKGCRGGPSSARR